MDPWGGVSPASTKVRGGFLKVTLDAADHAAFGAHGCATDGGRLDAGDKSDDRGDFFGCFETLEERAGAGGFEEFLFHLGRREASLLGQAIEKTDRAFRGGGAGKDGVYGDSCAGYGLGQ